MEEESGPGSYYFWHFSDTSKSVTIKRRWFDRSIPNTLSGTGVPILGNLLRKNSVLGTEMLEMQKETSSFSERVGYSGEKNT